MDEDELELKILSACIERYESAAKAAGGDRPTGSKCDREVDVREFLAEVTGLNGGTLTLLARQWVDRLASLKGPGRPLRSCSDGTLRGGPHRYHVRAYEDGVDWPAWDRVRQLRAALAARQPTAPTREREQKFGILLSARQAERDFAEWTTSPDVPVAVLFVDVDDFKLLNARHTETKVDKTLLPEAMRLLDRLTRWRGAAYRQGGDEFLVILPNHDSGEGLLVAEKIRATFERHPFEVDGVRERVMVSIGLAMSPRDGATFGEVLQAANEAKRQAKHTKNIVVVQ